MKSAGGRRVVPAVVVGVAVSFVPTWAPSQAFAVEEAATTVTATPSTTVAEVGGEVVVKGTVTATARRDVQLQQLSGRSWRTLSSTSTDGSYVLTVPTASDGISHYRVFAPASGRQAAGSTATFVIGVGGGDPDAYAFLTKPPVRWDPCTPIGYRVNLDGAPEDALADVRQAVSYASMASGVPFRYLGSTKVVPGAKDSRSLQDYPDDTQLVVAYTSPSGSRHLQGRGNVLGVGGVFYDLTPQKVGKNTWHRAVQGYVVINNQKDLPGGFGRGRQYGELGTGKQMKSL